MTDLIANCQHYLQQNQCETCASGYQLVNQQQQVGDDLILNYCYEKQMDNCEVEEVGKSSCITCNSAYKKVLQDDVNICTQVPAENCQQYEIDTCILCDTTYYLENGTCHKADAIANCGKYNSKTTCERCNQGSILSADGATCASTSSGINDRCEHFRELTN